MDGDVFTTLKRSLNVWYLMKSQDYARERELMGIRSCNNPKQIPSFKDEGFRVVLILFLILPMPPLDLLCSSVRNLRHITLGSHFKAPVSFSFSIRMRQQAEISCISHLKIRDGDNSFFCVRRLLYHLCRNSRVDSNFFESRIHSRSGWPLFLIRRY